MTTPEQRTSVVQTGGVAVNVIGVFVLLPLVVVTAAVALRSRTKRSG